MNQICQEAQELCNSFFQSAGLSIEASLNKDSVSCAINFDGEDASLLRNEGGEMLDAVEHLINKIYAPQMERSERILCDVQGFRQTRETELRFMAQHAAEQIRKTRVPFKFAPMNANERRILHLALAESEDLTTESVGEGTNRHLVIRLKD